MAILTKTDPTYTTEDLGFNKLLIKIPEQDLFDGLTPELKNIISEGISPKNIISGDLVAALNQLTQNLHSGKTAFSTADTGYILGVDPSDGLAKFYLGDATNYLYFDGSTLQVTGGSVIGSVGGFVVTATALTGGDLVISSSGQSIGWGTGNNIMMTDANDATYRLWIGNSTASLAPFSVQRDGTVNIDSGTIDGVTIGGSSAGTGIFTTLTATSIVIGGNTITTSEWANLDGLNQTVASTSSPTFVNLTITSFAANWTNAGRTVADMGTLTTVDINGGTLDGVTIGGSSAAAATITTLTVTSIVIGANTVTTSEWAFLDGLNQTVATTSSPTFVNLSITSMAQNWTNAGRTVADMGILTTVDINGGTIDGVTIGGSSAAAGTFTSLTDSGLTSGRVPFATTNGLLTDDADLTFATDTLTATKIVGTTSVKVGTAAGFISSDGSTGATGTFISADGTPKTITVKDGIITSIV